MTSITRIFSRLQNAYASRHEPERLRPIAIAYWRSVLISALIVGILILGGGVWLFYSVITALNTTDSGVSTPAPALDRAKLQSTLSDYEARAQRFEELKSEAPTVFDPSRSR